jgi:methylase of polypeptide subunit release factors
MKQVSVDNAAQIVGVSTATIRNWTKAGHICPASTRPLTFLEESVLDLKKKINSNEFTRLKTRANKAASESRFFPEEYANNSTLALHIARIISCVKDDGLEIEPTMFLCALHLLAGKGEVSQSSNIDPFDLESCHSWTRQSVKNVITEWRNSLNIKLKNRYNNLYRLLCSHEEEDYLGLTYQSISSEGSKSEQGSYYTPTKLVSDSLSHFKSPIATFLDPCCGTGKYLIHAAKIFHLEPVNILGFDLDPIAINIARVNLLLAYRDRDFMPKIYCMDSLSELATGEIFCETNNLLGSIDAIATNPPWGAYKNNSTKKKLSESITTGETFSLFLEKSIRLLRNGGQLSFILPESILKVRTHSDIRSLIFSETRINTISLLGRQFTGVYTPVIRLDLVKETPNEDWLVAIEHGRNSHQVAQSRFRSNDNFTFDIHIKSNDEELLDRIYSVEHTTLSGNAEWALGIVTGDNKKYIKTTPELGTEPIYRGSDVCPYRLGDPRSYIHFEPEQFQQVASVKYYRAPEKLIYKFISKSLAFAYDDKRCLSLNSANVLIPRIPGMSIKVALAFLNSKVFQYIFMKKFSTHKVLRGDLEKLPFPLIGADTHNTIERLIDSAIVSDEKIEDLHRTIFQAFRLNEQDAAVINNTLNG